MKITQEWVEQWDPCERATELAAEHGLGVGSDDVEVARFFAERRFEFANWFIVRRLNRADRLRYACHAARLVLPVWESRYPDDLHPRKAIEAAEACIGHPTAENRRAARAARAAAWATEAAAAWAAAWAAEEAAWASAATWAATWAVKDDPALEPRILEYGIALLEARKQ